jgi:hypothetical protein
MAKMKSATIDARMDVDGGSPVRTNDGVVAVGAPVLTGPSCGLAPVRSHSTETHGRI